MIFCASSGSFGSNIYDILPPSVNKNIRALCTRCVSFKKIGDCKKGLLDPKKVLLKSSNCDKFYDKDAVRTYNA